MASILIPEAAIICSDWVCDKAIKSVLFFMELPACSPPPKPTTAKANLAIFRKFVLALVAIPPIAVSGLDIATVFRAQAA